MSCASLNDLAAFELADLTKCRNDLSMQQIIESYCNDHESNNCTLKSCVLGQQRVKFRGSAEKFSNLPQQAQASVDAHFGSMMCVRTSFSRSWFCPSYNTPIVGTKIMQALMLSLAEVVVCTRSSSGIGGKQTAEEPQSNEFWVLI